MLWVFSGTDRQTTLPACSHQKSEEPQGFAHEGPIPSRAVGVRTPRLCALAAPELSPRKEAQAADELRVDVDSRVSLHLSGSAIVNRSRPKVVVVANLLGKASIRCLSEAIRQTDACVEIFLFVSIETR